MNTNLSQALLLWLQWHGRESATLIAQRIRESGFIQTETDLSATLDRFRQMTLSGYELASQVASKHIDRDKARAALHDRYSWLTHEALDALWKDCCLWSSH
jgi:hypothetical protein